MKKSSLFLSLVLLGASGMLVATQAIGKPTLTQAAPSVTTTPSTPGQGRGRLQSGQMVACEAHQTAIQTRSQNMTRMAQNMEVKFTNIANRVEAYYTNTLLPSDKSVSNYQALLTSMQTQETAVTTALDAAQTDATNFSCSGSDPKGEVLNFKTDMLNVIQALKNYRTSITNLIVAVSKVAGTTEPSTTPTTSPTVSPTVSITQGQ